MSSLEEYRRHVLSGLVDPDQTEAQFAERLALATSYLSADMFEDNERRVWQAVTHYGQVTGQPLRPSEFDSVLSRAPGLLGAAAETSELFRELATMELAPGAYRLAVVRTSELWREQSLTETLAAGLRALSAPVEVERGRVIYGPEEALAYVRERSAAVEQRTTGAVPLREGPISEETASILRQYRSARTTSSTGILTGFPTLDRLTDGMAPGELWLVGGFAGEGKSKVAYNIAWHAAYAANRNVLFATLEADRDQVMRNIVVRHSHQFSTAASLRAPGLDYAALKRGELDEEGERLLATTLADIANPGHGVLYVAPLPYRATSDHLRALVAKVNRSWPLDLIVVDYLGLMSSASRRTSRREELDDLLVSAKRIAVEGVGGRPLPVLSPWQVSRDAYSMAYESGSYTRSAMAETAQAERSADLILTLLRRKEDRSTPRLHAQVLKYRDGSSDTTFTLHTSFATSLVTERATAASELNPLEGILEGIH